MVTIFSVYEYYNLQIYNSRVWETIRVWEVTFNVTIVAVDPL
jgi:hypothetical protein